VQPQSLPLRTETPTRPQESLSGLIERVTFFNEENGWAVLKVKAKGHRDLLAVVGSVPSVSAGEWVTAEESWIQDREFGLQFRAVMLNSTAPTTREGIEKYLGSGMVKGIGPVYAKKLVEKFGETIFDIIEKESGRLEDVGGIGPKRRQKIKEAWAEQKVIRNIMVFLHSNGVSIKARFPPDFHLLTPIERGRQKSAFRPHFTGVSSCLRLGAGEGNRTLISGLGSPHSTTEPHPLSVPENV
jgi:hypothetical protein